MNGQYINNLETGKLELHFTKVDYMALSDADKSKIKSACLFSGRHGCWVSRSSNSHWRAIEVAKDLGLTDGGTTGERLSFAEQQERIAEKAEARAERMAEYAENAKERAAQAFDRADLREEKSGIPFGQPILVGHHSEGKHRRAIERADNAMRKGIEESDKAKYFERRAASASYTASQADLTDKRYLQNRIDENTAHLRDCQRRIEKYCSAPGPADEYKQQLTAAMALYQEKIDYFTDAMNALGGVAYSRANVKPGDFVKVRGRWEKVVKCNGKTVAITSCFPWAMKYPWAEVQEHKQPDNVCPDGPKCADPVCQEERAKNSLAPA